MSSASCLDWNRLRIWRSGGGELFLVLTRLTNKLTYLPVLPSAEGGVVTLRRVTEIGHVILLAITNQRYIFRRFFQIESLIDAALSDPITRLSQNITSVRGIRKKAATRRHRRLASITPSIWDAAERRKAWKWLDNATFRYETGLLGRDRVTVDIIRSVVA